MEGTLRGCSGQLTRTRTRNRETSRPRYVIMAAPNNMAQAIWPPERGAPSMVRPLAQEGLWAKGEGGSYKRGTVQRNASCAMYGCGLRGSLFVSGSCS